jgi:hypothetical protein
MTRMIDGLGDVARAAGDDAASNLSASVTIDDMESRIRRGVRRRRQSLSAVAAVAILVAGAGAVVTPRLLADVPLPSGPIEPAGPEVVRTDGGLTVYADGTMSVLTDQGAIVDLPAPGPDAVPYVQVDAEQACAADPAAFEPGWDYATAEAQQLLGHGRPQYVDEAGTRHPVVQGQQVPTDRFGDLTALAFELEAEPALAQNIAFRATSLVEWDGLTMGYTTQLDGAPGAEVVGEGSAQETAVVGMRPLPGLATAWCVDAKGYKDIPAAYVTRYLVIDVFVIDHAGSSTLLATHTSWTGTELTQ